MPRKNLLSRALAWALRRTSDSTFDEMAWDGWGWSVPSAAGVPVNQQTALNATAVMACVTILAEDVAKLTPRIYRRLPNGGRELAKDHFLFNLLRRPNDWQSGLEFREMMQISLVLRGNAYAVIARTSRGIPYKLIPINADRVALWEAPSGGLFYRVTPIGLHEMAELKDEPFLIPADDMLHIRGFSLNGLLGASRIMLAKEAIGLTIAQERQASEWAGNGAQPSGVLQTDQKLTEPAAKRMAAEWRDSHSGVRNTGKILVLEQGLKFNALNLSASDMQFIASRQFQLAEICRIWRIPPHMVGELSRSTNNNIAQQAQEYANYTLTGYTARWSSKLDAHFDLEADDLFIDWDFSILTKADLPTRYNAYRTGIMSMFLTPNEARIDDGRDPVDGGDKLYQPLNMDAVGSQSSGEAPQGAGRPPQEIPEGMGPA